jgi:putative SOS response-associated peptidase YedK
VGPRSAARGAAPLINARAETLVAKPLFARGDRVLVPADGWYEWLRAEDGRRARPQPFLHTVDGGRSSRSPASCATAGWPS